MKEIRIEFSNDQCEVLDHISRMCKKDTSDFIREALVCLLPLNEYIEAKNNLIVLKNKHRALENQQALKQLSEKIREINISTSNRLKRIGILN